MNTPRERARQRGRGKEDGEGIHSDRGRKEKEAGGTWCMYIYTDFCSCDRACTCSTATGETMSGLGCNPMARRARLTPFCWSILLYLVAPFRSCSCSHPVLPPYSQTDVKFSIPRLSHSACFPSAEYMSSSLSLRLLLTPRRVPVDFHKHAIYPKVSIL